MKKIAHRSWGLVATATLLFMGCGAFEADLTQLPPPGTPSPCYKNWKPETRSSPMVCTGTCTTLVINKILFPTDSTEAERAAFKCSDKLYNSLGGILALFESQFPDLAIQKNAERAVASGLTLNLFRYQAGAGVDKIQGQFRVATSQVCCTYPVDLTSCWAEAAKGCFNGKHAFSADPKIKPGQVLDGTAAQNGALSLTPGTVRLSMNLLSPVPLLVPLYGAQVRGVLTSEGIINGVIAGAVDKQFLDNVLIPHIASLFNLIYTSDKTDYQTRSWYRTLFDTDKDGKITSAEMKNNGLFRTFLDGDLDLDGDGVKELSMGFGFTAVPAKLATP